MKFNIDFPFAFHDLSNEEFSLLDFKINQDIIRFNIDLTYITDTDFDFKSIDIAIEIENTQTFFRKLFILNPGVIDIVNISLNDLGSKFKYNIIFVAKQNGNIRIKDTEDYYQRGDCIGLLEQGNMILVEDEGIVGLIKVGGHTKDTIEYDLTSDWITILLPQIDYEKYIIWQNDDETTPYILSSLGNSCIQFALLQAKEKEEYKNYKWWETISVYLDSLGVSLDDLDPIEIPQITNQFLNNCFQKMLELALPVADVEDTSIFS